MTLAIFLVISLILVGIQTAIPFLVKRTIIFGVTVPEQHINHPKLTSYKKRYALLVSLLAVVVLACYLVWVLWYTPLEGQTVFVGTLIQFGIILFSLSLYFYFHGKTQQLKKENKWLDNLKQLKIADLSVRSQDEMLPWYLHIVPILLTIGVIGYTILHYNLLPDQIPTHWGITGEADAFTEKTPMAAVQMPVTLLLIQLMFLALQVGTKKSGIKLSATSTNASRMRQLSLRKYTSWLMFFISFLITIMFSLFQLKTIHPDLFAGAIVTATPLIFLIIMLGSTIAFSVKVGRSDKHSNDEPIKDITDYDEDAYWIGGLLYFNRNDPSILVEKRFGVGWTLNFANPIGYIIILLPLIAILVFSFM